MSGDRSRSSAESFSRPSLLMKQITLVVENRPNVVSEISELLARQGVNIESISADGIGNIGIILLMVDRHDFAVALLREAGYDATIEDALVVQLRDQPGSLAAVCRRFLEAGVNIQSLRIIRRGEGLSLVAISTNRTHEAMELVRDLLVT